MKFSFSVNFISDLSVYNKIDLYLLFTTKIKQEEDNFNNLII